MPHRVVPAGITACLTRECLWASTGGNGCYCAWQRLAENKTVKFVILQYSLCQPPTILCFVVHLKKKLLLTFIYTEQISECNPVFLG